MYHLPPALRPFVTLSYGIPTAEGWQYGKGIDDVKFVLSCAVAWTVLRHVAMVRLLSPLARVLIPTERVSKHGSPAEQRLVERQVARRREHNAIRFAEQAWGMLYCLVFWSLGLVSRTTSGATSATKLCPSAVLTSRTTNKQTILSRTPDRFTPESIWGSYPVTPIPGLTKFYYLGQLGWWFHQIYTINSEKPRKDYHQMFGHHILSIALITSSYIANYTRVGIIVHALMDCCDIFLPLAKLLRYMQFRQACDAAFVVFLITWVITRQVGLFLVIRSVYVEVPKFIEFKWAPEENHYLTPAIYYGFVAMLTILLVLCTVWFYMAVMVAVRVVRGQGAEDSRSDSEEDDEVSVDGDSERELRSATSSGRNTPAGVAGYATARVNGNGVKRRK